MRSFILLLIVAMIAFFLLDLTAGRAESFTVADETETEIAPENRRARLSEAITSDGRESYLRAKTERQNGELYARLTGHQGSGNLFSMVQANALLIIPAGVKSLPANAEVELWMLA